MKRLNLRRCLNIEKSLFYRYLGTALFLDPLGLGNVAKTRPHGGRFGLSSDQLKQISS
jgi:hypothetical protein